MHHETNRDWFVTECTKADSFNELVPIALEQLHKFPHGAQMVCGPITTGGRGSIEENTKVFNLTIRALVTGGLPIFNQIPYEERIFFFRNRWIKEDPSRKSQYFMPILEEFYLPLFETKLITGGWFIPGWRSSFGACWEYEQFQRLGVPVVHLNQSWVTHLAA